MDSLRGIVIFLNTNAGSFSVVFSLVVAIATVVYAWLTWRLVSETRLMRKSQTEPKVAIEVRPREEAISFMELTVKNIGMGPAYNLRFRIDPDFEYDKGSHLSQLGFLKNGISYLAPAQKLTTFLTSMLEDFDEKIKVSFRISVDYENASGDQLFEEFGIEFSQFEGLVQLGEPPLHKMAKAMEKMQKDIGKLTSGWSRLKVVTYNQEDIKAEAAQTKERRRAMNEQAKMDSSTDSDA